jgi:hypothetical protein
LRPWICSLQQLYLFHPSIHPWQPLPFPLWPLSSLFFLEKQE